MHSALLLHVLPKTPPLMEFKMMTYFACVIFVLDFRFHLWPLVEFHTGFMAMGSAAALGGLAPHSDRVTMLQVGAGGPLQHFT